MLRRVQTAAGPVRERPDGDHVGVVLAVGVRQHAAQQRDQLGGAPAVWTWVETRIIRFQICLHQNLFI